MLLKIKDKKHSNPPTKSFFPVDSQTSLGQQQAEINVKMEGAG